MAIRTRYASYLSQRTYQELQAEAEQIKKFLDDKRKLSRISRYDIPKPEPRTKSPGHSGQPKSLDDKEKPLCVPKSGNGHENRKAKEEQPAIITISYEISTVRKVSSENRPHNCKPNPYSSDGGRSHYPPGSDNHP